jgi:hypothetical protein
MSPSPSSADFDAAQARLHAWRSRRPGVLEWAALEAILGLDEFLVRARQPPFGRWLEGISVEPSLHEIDRCLRDAFRRDCATMAGWYGPPWDAALGRLAAAVDLPLLAQTLRGEPTAAAMLADARWRTIHDATAEQRFAVATQLGHTAAAPTPDADLFVFWIRAWLASLPRGGDAARDGFANLARAVGAYRALGAAEPRSAARTASMAERLALLFRQHAGTPVAMACELVAIVLDLHRLRSGLVRRALAKRTASVAA